MAPNPRRFDLWFLCCLGALFIASLLLRLAVANDLASLAIQHLPVLDERVHDQLAQEILSSGWQPERPFFKAPLYPYFLAACYTVFGHSFPAVRVVQSAIGALTALLIAGVGHRVAGRAGALTSGAIAALYAQTILYAALLMKATLDLFFMSLFVLLGVSERGGGQRRVLPFLSGVALGLASLLRGNLLVLLPIVVLWRLCRGRAAPGARPLARLTSAALPAVGVLLVVMPFATLNYLASGELILTESTAGITFFLGNRQGASGFYEALYPGRQGPNFEEIDGRRKAAEILTDRGGTPVAESSVTSAAASRVLAHETWRQIAQRPGQWLRLVARKFLLFWNAYEAPTGNSIQVYKLATPWLRLDPVTFGVVAPLGLFGLLVLLWQRRHVFLPVAAFGVCASVVAFFVMERFRFPLLPALIPAVFPGLEALATASRARALGRAAALGGLLLACIVLVHLPLVSARQRAGDQAIAHYHFGRAESELSQSELRQGLTREGAQRSIAAERNLARAIELDDRLLPARVELAVVLLRRGTALLRAGRPVEALDSYRHSRASLKAAFDHPSAGEFTEILDQADRELIPLLELNESRAAAAIESARRPD